MLDPVLQRFSTQFDEAVGRWSELLRIPSVSTDPAYGEDMGRAARWLVAALEEIGFSAEIRETGGHPVVVGHHPGPGAGASHLLYYGHYDVQPPDPVEQWDSAPFEPTLVDGPHGQRMVARGAVDDKGQLMMWLEALRAWQAEHGTLPMRTTVLIEGEEEVGSKHLRPFLEQHCEELSADVCVVSDTTMWDVDTPAITYMLRGLLYTEVTCHGPGRDLHSGFYGGAVANPLNALSHILGGLHDERGRVQIPGFYDDVAEPSDTELAQWRALAFDQASFLGQAGVTEPGGGEIERSLLERIWARPTADINGLVGGYTGAGAKTVIPTHGSAKLSFRLVPEQEPERIIENFRAFLDARTPTGCHCEIEVHSSAPAIRIPPDSPWLQAAERALAQVYGREPVRIGAGGSIPIAAWARDILGMDALLMGFSLEDDGMHSPNEKFELTCFERGTRSHLALIGQLAGA